jgi:dTDP-4-dehydrorhamnose reductase
MINILVTGSNGQLGNELKVLASSLSQAKFLFHDVDTLDITNFESLSLFFKENKPAVIVNCAAYTAVDRAESEVEKAFLINDKAVENIKIIACKYACKIIHISTDYVFDGNRNVPYKEDDTTNPLSIYGKSKLAGEKHLAMLPNAIIIRTAWLYSSFGNNFVKTMIRLGKEKKEIKVVFDQIGSPTYAADLSQVIIEILKQTNDTNFKPGIYHFSNEGACSWFDFASEIMFQSKLNCKVYPIETHEYPTPVKRPAFSVFNKAKIKKVYNITIPWWKDSLKVCLEKINSNSEFKIQSF